MIAPKLGSTKVRRSISTPCASRHAATESKLMFNAIGRLPELTSAPAGRSPSSGRRYRAPRNGGCCSARAAWGHRRGSREVEAVHARVVRAEPVLEAPARDGDRAERLPVRKKRWGRGILRVLEQHLSAGQRGAVAAARQAGEAHEARAAVAADGDHPEQLAVHPRHEVDG